MNLKEFLSLILPSTGTYYTAQLNHTGDLRQFKHDTLAQAEAALMQIKRRNLNAFIATGSFKGKRQQKDVALKRVWYVDIDCKKGGQYATQDEAKAALREALRAGLPMPTTIVDSGNGLHLYWVIDTGVTKSQWQPYAKALMRCCEATKLKVDSNVTTDSARILRAPDTLNWKDPDHPKPCKAGKAKHIYDFEEWSELLNPYLSGPAALPPVDNSDLTGGMDGKPALAKHMVEQCPLFVNSLSTGGEQDAEPLWKNLVLTLTKCEDGHDYLHPISDKHPTYDPDAAEKKWAQQAAKIGGAVKCETYQRENPDCLECPHWGKINSPIKLAYHAPVDLTQPPYPWRNNASRLERHDPENDEWDFAARYPVKNFTLTIMPGLESILTTIEIGGEVIQAPSASLSDAKFLSSATWGAGVSLENYEVQEMIRLMAAWTEQLKQHNAVVVGVSHLGWTESGFHYGGMVYPPGGNSLSSKSNMTSGTFAQYMPKGSIQVWAECAQHVLDQDRPALWAVIASAFAAPLMKFTGVQGGTLLSVVSQESGTGKSTAMRIAQAVWGDPVHGIAHLDDTGNAVAHKMGTICHLPAYWDEVREKKETYRLITNLFRIVQGREKQRLNSQIHLRQSGAWSTLMTLATNEPIRDHLKQMVKNSDAGYARVFELRVRKPQKQDKLNAAAARHMFQRLDNNYGMAGDAYARELARNYDRVVDRLHTVDRHLTEKLKAKDEERFWVATLASLFVGMEIANDLQLCSFQLGAARKYLINEFMRHRSNKADDYTAPQERGTTALSQFLHAKIEYVVKAKHMPKRGGSNEGILNDPRLPVVARIAVNDAKLRILKDEFERWYNDAYGSGVSHVIENLKDAGALFARGPVDTGMQVSAGGRPWHIEIDLTAPAFTDLKSIAGNNTDNTDLG